MTSLRTKQVVEIPTIYNKMPKVTHIPSEYKMNFDQILNKPFLVNTINWSTTDTANSELPRLQFPSAIMTNPLARVPFNSATFYQAKMCCMLQVSGTPMHQGLLLIAAVPHKTPNIYNANAILCAPHVFLNASESTSVCLECPMYTPSTLYRTIANDVTSANLLLRSNERGTDIFDLVVFIMDPLATGAGSSTTVSVSVHCIFKEAEFYVPKVGNLSWQNQGKIENFEAESFLNNLWRLPTTILDNVASGLKVVAGDLIDYGRGMVKQLTGFHNPNIPAIDKRVLSTFRNFPNNVDQPVHLEVMDNHAQFSRVYDDYYFRTDQDEMDLRYLLSKPTFVGKFSVSSSTVVGKNLFAYPMTPMVEVKVTGRESSTSFNSPMRTIYEASRFWRGGLKLHIQAVCTNFHFCKMLVLKQYAVTAGVLGSTTVPKYEDVHNMNVDTLEFSAGGQIQTIDLPYCSNLRQLECTKDVMFNMVNHGMVYAYLVQPLVYNGNVPTTVTFNVYISGAEDLEFSGYAVDNVHINIASYPTTAASVMDYTEDSEAFTAEGNEADGITTLVIPNTQESLLIDTTSDVENPKMAFRPNTSIRDYIRFMYPQETVVETPTSTKNIVAFPLNKLFNKHLRGDYLHALTSMYLGVSGGFKIKFKISGVSAASAIFVPPSTFCISSSFDRLYNMSNQEPVDVNSAADFIKGMTYNPSLKSYTAPQIEMQDYTRPFNSSSATVSGRPGISCVLEMAIPNMNPYNFVGNAAKWYGGVDPENDIGVVYINYDASYDGTSYAKVQILPFIGYNDEARLGFQVFAPGKQIPTFTTTSPVVTCRSSVFRPEQVTPAVPNGISVNPLPVAPTGYYFN